ncbi:hypothetical protein XENTR_v10012427 [Xenopus tropicalis]|nr:hypothetical protein XENTR_v10012427 [Xenopus tropicalis]
MKCQDLRFTLNINEIMCVVFGKGNMEPQRINSTQLHSVHPSLPTCSIPVKARGKRQNLKYALYLINCKTLPHYHHP